MLAAVSARNNPALNLFLLALVMADRKEQASAALKAYFEETLSQAKSMIDNPSRKATSISPDAIRLAAKIVHDADVRDALAQVSDFDSLSAPIASAVLKKMEFELEGSS